MQSYRDGFTQFDLGVVLLTLLGTVYIATFHILRSSRRATTSVKNFIIGERNIPLIPAALSLACGVAPLYIVMPIWSLDIVSGGSYPVRPQGVQLACALGAVLSAFFTSAIVMPTQYQVFAEDSSVSIYTYLERRFSNRLVAAAAAVVFVFQALVLLTAVIYFPSLAIAAVTGFPIEVFILLIGIIPSLYSALAGIRFVVWAAVYQCILLAIGFLITLGRSAQVVGGVRQLLWTHTYNTIRSLNPALIVSEASSFWILLPAFFVHWTLAYIAVHPLTQVVVSVKDSRRASHCIWMGSAVIGALLILAGITGNGLVEDCGPALASFGEYGQVGPLLYFVQNGYRNIVGVSGLFVAAVLNACIGFVSAWSVSISAVILENIIKPIRAKNRGEKNFEHPRHLAKLFEFIPGALAACVALAFNGSLWSSELMRATFALVLALTGPLGALFLLGVLVPSCDDKGALVGFSCGVKICLTISVVAAYHNDLFSFLCARTPTEAVNSVNEWCPTGNSTSNESFWLPYVWGAPISMSLTFLAAMVATVVCSLFSGRKSTPPNARLLSPCALSSIERASCSANQIQLEAPVKLLSAKTRRRPPEEISAVSAN